MPKASIIVPMYNCQDTIVRCVDSLILQSEKDIEIILVDDGSKDNTLKICREKSKTDNRIIIFSKENGGVSSARNYGIKNATGDFLLFCDSDDTVETNWCEKLLENSSEEVLSICGYNRYINEQYNNSVTIQSDEAFIDSKDFLSIGYGIQLGSTCNKCFSRNIVLNNELFFDETTSFEEDVIFVLTYIRFVKKISIHNECLYNYFFRENSLISKSKNYDEAFIMKVYNLAKDVIMFLNGDFSKYEKVHYNAVFSSLEPRIKDKESAKRIIKNKEFQYSIRFADKTRYDKKYLLLLKLKSVNLILKLK